MITLLFALLTFIPDYHILGPGALSYTPVLETVAQRRITYGFGLSNLEAGAVLIAPANCDYLGRRGWLIAGGEVRRAVVVDCAQPEHREAMQDSGILADVSEPGLGYEVGWVILE